MRLWSLTVTCFEVIFLHFLILLSSDCFWSCRCGGLLVLINGSRSVLFIRRKTRTACKLYTLLVTTDVPELDEKQMEVR